MDIWMDLGNIYYNPFNGEMGMYDSYVLNDVSTDTIIGPASTNNLHPIMLDKTFYHHLII